MYGAIFGDIIGSRFEFDRGGKTKTFELFTKEDDFTDDTAMTIAVGEGLLNAGKDASLEDIHKSVISSMRKWGYKYPYAGYGGRFFTWLFESKNPKPYGSFGNGSAMRVSAAGWLYDSLERTREVAKATAEVTHNHPEGIKGAECTAAVMYLARTGKDKEEIKRYVSEEFGYDLSKSVDQFRPLHEHVETCQDSMPKALVSFFEGKSYEDVIRNAVSLGGDTDTLAAIAGAMAEAYYGIPVRIMVQGMQYLPEDMLQVLELFDSALGRKQAADAQAAFEPNRHIKNAILELYKTNHQEEFFLVLEAILKRVQEGGQVPTPMVDLNQAICEFDLGNIVIGDQLTLARDINLKIDTMQDPEGNLWIPLFTDYDELHKGQTTNICINMEIRSILENGLHMEAVTGVVINPFGESLTLQKDIIKEILDYSDSLAKD